MNSASCLAGLVARKPTLSRLLVGEMDFDSSKTTELDVPAVAASVSTWGADVAADRSAHTGKESVRSLNITLALRRVGQFPKTRRATFVGLSRWKRCCLGCGRGWLHEGLRFLPATRKGNLDIPPVGCFSQVLSRCISSYTVVCHAIDETGVISVCPTVEEARSELFFRCPSTERTGAKISLGASRSFHPLRL